MSFWLRVYWRMAAFVFYQRVVGDPPWNGWRRNWKLAKLWVRTTG